MDIKKMQQIVDRWVTRPEHEVKYFPPFQMTNQLTEEVGEVAREIADLHGFKKKKDTEKTDGLEVELGDVLFALICLANDHHIDLTNAFEKSMDKKLNRDKRRFIKK
ncbi:MAG TPA: MazG nucleotide pyrophosphohydrolase domain-containing protein [Candidatus Paceibacterota bacterium]|jgi:NTP pyrophosphatase (non-canonical NTP hydrolase)|nr:MazG nucleotide pyrophosphohydrolase domain-containing protein [Candidatus Paceibacterota bacterium]